MRRKVVLDKGNRNRERPVKQKPLSFHLEQERVLSSELERRVGDECKERDMMPGMAPWIPSVKRKTKMVILKTIFSLNGSQ